ncbi:MAG: SdpI family protein, partial [Bacteroidetes bacterium]|nr:SdpI family protein [Bacteroidota bacterium]
IPTHFNVKGQPDDYSSKMGFVYIILTVIVLVFGIFLLLQNIDKIDPKRVDMPISSTFNIISMGLVFFLTVINLFMIMKSAQNINIMDKAEVPFLGLLFAFLGNYMYNIKPNYFVGIRIPWTLNSDYNWRKTHQLAGRIWFVGGILLTIVSLLVSAIYAHIILSIALAIMVIIPIGYSFMLFKKEKDNPGIAKKDIE